MGFNRAPVLILAVSLSGMLGACDPNEAHKTASTNMLYRQLLRTLYRHTVPTVRPAAQVRELAQPNPPLLLDARTPVEFSVSHLRGARFVPFDSIATEQFADLPRTQPVVVYCSVGVRSERLGERLAALGFQNVHNLYGGLFEWVNEGYPVYDATGVTSNIHPYSPVWSPWLKRGQKCYE